MKWRSLEESAEGGETRSLAQVFAERKKLIAKYVPTDIQAIHERAISEVRESGVACRASRISETPADFELANQNGMLLRTADLLQKGRLVIRFFRGRWCPFCVGQLEAMNSIYPQIQALRASLIGISPQNGTPLLPHGRPASVES